MTEGLAATFKCSFRQKSDGLLVLLLVVGRNTPAQRERPHRMVAEFCPFSVPYSFCFKNSPGFIFLAGQMSESENIFRLV